MIKHKVITLRTFDECSPELQKKILDKYRYFETEAWFWADCESDIVSDMLHQKYGFICFKDDMRWDLSCSQGSGASFTCSDFQWDVLLKDLDISHKKWWIKYLDSCGFKIVCNDHHYTGSWTCRWDTGDYCKLDWYGAKHEYPHLYPVFCKIMDYIEEIRDEACGEMYSQLDKDRDYYESDEYLTQLFVDNEYYFNADGEIDG